MNTLLTIAWLLAPQVQETPPEPIQHSPEVRKTLAEQIEKNRRPRTVSSSDGAVYSVLQLPDDPKQQGVFVLHDTSGFGRAYSLAAFRYFMVSRLQIANLTDQDVRLPMKSIRLRLGKNEYVHEPWVNGSATVRLKNRGYQLYKTRSGSKPPQDVVLKPGEVKQVHAIFQNIPQGGLYESVDITVTGLDQPVAIDLIAAAEQAMQLELARTGPRDCLVVATIGGSIDQVGAHVLANKLQPIVAAGASRMVLLWDELGDSTSQSRRVDMDVKTWLTQTAVRNPGYSYLPLLPAGLQEIHLGPFPGGLQVRSITAPDQKVHLHATKLKAVSAALLDVYRQLPTQDVLDAIASDDVTVRIAAIRGGAGRLPPTAIPMLMQMATGNKDVQAATVHALSQFADQTAIDFVAEFVTAMDKDLAVIATQGLMSSRFPAAQRKLINVVKSLEGQHRKRAVEILVDEPNAIWADLYFEYASDFETDVALARRAFLALDQIGHPRLRELRSAALECEAFRALSTSGDAEDTRLVVEYTLRRIAKHPPTPEMLNVLQQSAANEATQHLMRHLRNEKSASRRGQFLNAIIRIGDQSITPFLLETYAGTKNRPRPDQQRITILNALFARRVPEALDLAAEAMNSANPTLVATACRILEEDATPKAVAAITDMLIRTADNSESRKFQVPRLQCLRSLGAIATPQARRYLRIVQNNGNERDRLEAENQLRGLLIRSPAIDYLAQASELRENRKLAEAEEIYAAALRADPGLPEIYIQRGHMKTHNGRRSEGVQDFDLALEIDPLHPIATSLKAIAIVVLCDPEGGLKMVEDNAETFKRDEVFNYNAACAYGQALKTNKATPETLQLRKTWKDRGLHFLEHCVNKLGYAGEDRGEDARLFQTDPDLDPFREEDRFKELWKKIEPNVPKEDLPPQDPKPVEAPKKLGQ